MCVPNLRALCVLLGAVACQPAAGSSDTPPPFRVEAEIARWVAAWNAYDLDLVDGLFLMDDRVTYLSSEREGLITGPDSLIAHHAGMGFVPGGTAPEQELWVEDARATIFESAAVATGVWNFGDRSAPRDGVQRGPMTVVYVWAEDAYRIAHMHFANY